MSLLPKASYLSFPFRIGAGGGKTSARRAHVREQIEQVLFVDPGERVFRPQFGGGLRRLLFEPNATALWEVTKKRLAASLTEALQGEVDPRTLDVDVVGDAEQISIVVRYKLAAIGKQEEHTFSLGTVEPSG